MFFEVSVILSYSIFIVETNPDLISKSSNNLYKSVAIVVLPFVPVIPIKSIFEDGLL